MRKKLVKPFVYLFLRLFYAPAYNIVGNMSEKLLWDGVKIEMLIRVLRYVGLFAFWALLYSMMMDLSMAPTGYDLLYWLLLLPTFIFGFMYKIPHDLYISLYSSAIIRAKDRDPAVQEFFSFISKMKPFEDTKEGYAAFAKQWQDFLAKHDEKENTEDSSNTDKE